MFQLISLLRKLCAKPASRRILLVEALMYLLLARCVLVFLSFRQLSWLLNLKVRKHEVREAVRQLLRKEVSWAVNTVAECLPVKMVCFPRGIAAQAMLRRRGIKSTLYYGVSKLPDRGLVAHVWVKDGSDGVVGHANAKLYTVIMSYPQTG